MEVKGQKQATFKCTSCAYFTSARYDFDRHLMTKKHLSRTSSSTPFKRPIMACPCGNIYTHRQSLNKHRKKCSAAGESDDDSSASSLALITTNNAPTVTSDLTDDDDDVGAFMGDSEASVESKEVVQMVMQVVKELVKAQHTDRQADLQVVTELIKSQQAERESDRALFKDLLSRVGDRHSVQNINSNNKTFNLNVFLNETCKDAVNLLDFAETMDITLKDLVLFGEKGYVTGLSSAITKRLSAMDVTRRPIHCTDEKRKTVYVKDQGQWTQGDEKNQILRKAVLKVLGKNQYELFNGYKEMYPDCVRASSNRSDEFNHILLEVMGGKGDNLEEKNQSVIQKVIKSVVIDKEQFLIDK